LAESTPLPASIEIASARPDRAAPFWAAHDRAYLRERYGFPVVWHAQSHELVALHDERVVGAVRFRIAASLAHLDAVYVEEAARGVGIGRLLVRRVEEVAIYYNCHKVTLEVIDGIAAGVFFARCGYRVEAILQQHTFKLDVALLRKFLL